MEHAFDCFVDSHPRTPSTYRLNIGHTNERIEQRQLPPFLGPLAH
jgi:hypothetical protein